MYTPEKNKIGARIKRARKALGLTQQALAATSGIAVGTIKKYEGDERQPAATVLVRLAKVGINVDWLFSGDGPMLLNRENAERHADMVAAVLAKDPAAQQRREARVREESGRCSNLDEQQELSVTIDVILDQIGFLPPDVVLYALRQQVYTKALSVDGFIAILNALKTQSGDA